MFYYHYSVSKHNDRLYLHIDIQTENIFRDVYQNMMTFLYIHV